MNTLRILVFSHLSLAGVALLSLSLVFVSHVTQIHELSVRFVFTPSNIKKLQNLTIKNWYYRVLGHELQIYTRKKLYFK